MTTLKHKYNKINIAAILAKTPKGVIGLGNTIPWHIPSELAMFKKITLSYDNLVMGRKTFESLPTFLKGRKHIILTRTVGYTSKHKVYVYNNIKSILKNYSKFIVIGGAEVIEQFLPYLNTFHLSLLNNEYVGDVYFKFELLDFNTVKLVIHDEFTYYELHRKCITFAGMKQIIKCL